MNNLTFIVLLVANLLGAFLLWQTPLHLLLLTIIIGLVLLVKNSHLNLYLGILLAGILFEWYSVHLGIWQYGVPGGLGFPWWVPVSWANLVVILEGLLGRRNR